MYDLLAVEFRRPRSEKTSQLRKQGMIPGILFGKGMDSVPLQFSQNSFRKILAQGVKVFEVEVAAKERFLVNLEGLQRDPLTHEILHASFHKLNKNQTTHVLVPIKLEGKSIGTTEGGVVRQLLDNVMIIGLPHKIPESLVVDVESLGIGDHIKVEDIKLNHGLSFEKANLEKAIVNCAIPKVTEEPVSETAIIEVLDTPKEELEVENGGKISKDKAA